MQNISPKTLISGVFASIPLAIGYLPMAFSFGIVAVQAGLSAPQAILISLLVFAGAAQFVLASLLAAGSGPAAVVAAVWALNLRHVFYGPALLAHLRSPPGKLLPGLAFTLTDEVFATAMARSPESAPTPVWTLGLGLGAYSAWVGGTALGAVFGGAVSAASPFLAAALSFVLPALFIALIVQAFRRDQWRVIAGTVLITLGVNVLFPGHVAVLAGMLGGAVIRTIEVTRGGITQ